MRVVLATSNCVVQCTIVQCGVYSRPLRLSVRPRLEYIETRSSTQHSGIGHWMHQVINTAARMHNFARGPMVVSVPVFEYQQ